MKTVEVEKSLWSKGMQALVCAQFLSAFADNALLFAILAIIIQKDYPDWSQPVLQMLFVATYILGAPFVGRIADSFSKSRVMVFANLFKLIGAGLICFGFNPFVGYILVGIGAAAYSPAKYGILGELNHQNKLVQANSIIESSTIAAILLGTLLGGILTDWMIFAALLACVVAYASATLLSLFIPHLPAAKSRQGWQPFLLIKQFVGAVSVLWQSPPARFSLCATSLFWGAGVTLRFLLVLWVPNILCITGASTTTQLNGMVAVGIIPGAAAAAKFVTLKTVKRCMPAGILIGVTVAGFSLQSSLAFSFLLMTLIGIFGGFFVVPLNALLQEYGKRSVGAGNAIAVQNLGENSAMLLMLGGYALAVKTGISVVSIGVCFGLLFALVTGWLWWHNRNLVA